MDKKTKVLQSALVKIGHNLFHSLTPEEELAFYREVIDAVKANIYINQIDDITDFSTAHCVFINKPGQDQIGYRLEEIMAMGSELYAKTNHPDDVAIGLQTINFLALKKGDAFGGLTRQLLRNGTCRWCFGSSKVISEKDGSPWQFLNVSVDIQDELQTHRQLLELQRENFLLREQLSAARLGKREKEVLILIAGGRTDREVASELHISLQTARTHRKNLHKKTGKRKTAELAMFAAANGMI